MSITSQENWKREFPGGLVVKIPGFHLPWLGSIPGRASCAVQAQKQTNKKTGRKKKSRYSSSIRKFNKITHFAKKIKLPKLIQNCKQI